MNDPTIEGAQKTTVRIALANMGFEPRENETFILQALSRCDADVKRIMYDLAMVRASWPMTEEMILQLSNRLGTNTYESAMAVVAIGNLKSRGIAARKSLEVAHERSRTDRSQAAYGVIIGFSFVQIESLEREGIFRDTLSFFGSAEALSHMVEAAGYEVALKLSDDAMIRQLNGMLDDRDELVVLGAMRMLGLIGLPAQNAVPRLIELLRSAKSEKAKRKELEC